MKSWDTTTRGYPADGAPPVVIDTSALLAIFLGEPERNQFLDRITQAETRLISAANVLETGIVLEARRGEAAGREFDLFLHQAKFDVVAVDADQVEIARVAWRKYGRGRHPAGLNFGDCFAYALAKTLGERLLAKGTDFARTGIEMCREV
jgi:ribonuclease VapC